SSLFVANMTCGSYHTNVKDAVRNTVRLVRKGCVEGVKLEGGEEMVETARKLTIIGIPVIAHVGLLPQRHMSMFGHRVQGRTAESARRLSGLAVAMQDAG